MFFLHFYLPANFSTRPLVIKISRSDALHPLSFPYIQQVATSASPSFVLFLPSDIPHHLPCGLSQYYESLLNFIPTEWRILAVQPGSSSKNTLQIMLCSYLQHFHRFALFKEINSSSKCWHLVSAYHPTFSLCVVLCDNGSSNKCYPSLSVSDLSCPPVLFLLIFFAQFLPLDLSSN